MSTDTGIKFVLFEHNGKTVAVNPARVACVETGEGMPNRTCIRFSGLKDDHVSVSEPADEVIARLMGAF